MKITAMMHCGRKPVLPSRLPSLILAACLAAPASHALAEPNAIVTENALPGSPPSEWDVPAADASIQGFATEMSVNRGQTIEFKVNTPASSYRIDIYRMGYYGGMGARHIATVRPSVGLPQSQPPCLRDSATRLIDCGNWAVSASWTVPADAVSGIYIAKLVREDPEDGRASHIVFVVRDDDGRSKILFQTSDTTWQAYNNYLDFSLYSLTRAFKASYNRPVVSRGNHPWDWVFSAEYPMVRWLEHNGYDVSYFAGMDSDRSGAEILEHQVFLSVGHDEYWSRGQREAVEAARNAGVHLAFTSGNEIYWKTRWEPSIDASATPYRTLVCYKESLNGTKLDPLPGVWTGLWRDCSFTPPADGCEPENRLSGQMSWSTAICGTVTCGIQVPDTYRRMRLWRDTDIASLGPGQVATFPPATLGFEWDYQQYEDSNPAGLVWLSNTTVGGLTHHLSLYRHASGALVFGAGTIQWAWGLDDQHTNARLAPIAGAAPDARMQQATVNLFAEMGVQPLTLQPGLVAAVPTGDASPPTSRILSPAPGDSLLGGPVVIRGTASDAEGVVGVVEVSADGGATWKRASGAESWSYGWLAPSHAGTVTLRSRAADDLGNLETPDSGVNVTVGGPPIEIESIGTQDSVYVNGTGIAQIAVTTRSNLQAETGLSLRVSVTSNRGDWFEVGTDAFALGSHTQHGSAFSWALPAAEHPWEFSVTAELSRGGTVLGTLVRKAAFCGIVMSRTELQSAVDALVGPDGCWGPATACRTSTVGALPHFGSFANFASSLHALCQAGGEIESGRPLESGVYGLAALAGAVDVTLASLLRDGAVADVMPSALWSSLACHESLAEQGLGGELDSLASVVRAVFADAGRSYSNEILVRGPVGLRVGRRGHWTSRTSVGLRGAYVFDLGSTGFAWGHLGPEPLLIGNTETNPHATADLELRATGAGTVELGFLHRTAPGSIEWIRYDPIPVTASTVLRAVLSDDRPYPWGFGLFLDRHGKGVVDEILYPNGKILSDAGAPAGPRFRMLPNQPNPFNPSSTIRYVLPAPGSVTVTVQDVRGRVVRTLFSGTQTAGLQQIQWNARDGDGRRTPSGTYVVRIATRWGTAAQKLTLVK